MQRTSIIRTWNRNEADEEAMGAAHAPIWRRMIDVSIQEDLRQSTLLDYGCNQGGFLRMLYDRHPFQSAVGIDIARESVARADLLKGYRPIEYKVAESAATLGRTFDFAFSHEVLYLLPDLAAHAADIKAALKPGGTYVAAMGCHKDRAVWPRWRKVLAETSTPSCR
jgi:SAM-dependent methyltransferase